MTSILKKILFAVLLVACIFFAGFLTRECTFKTPWPTIVEHRDTIYVPDTVKVPEPVEVERIVKDTMFVDVGETIVVHDTTYLPLPREYVTYQDSSYRAVVSGFRPRLEELEMYPKKEIITIQTEKTIVVPDKKRFGVGVQAGYGITPAGFQPYLGVGISYNIFMF